MKFKRYTDVAVVFVLSILLLILSAFITANSLVASMVVTELALLLPALLFVILRKDNISCRFALKLPSIGNFFSSILIFVGMNALQNAVTFVLYPLYYNKTENPDIGMLDSFEGVSPYVLLIAIAVMPAICEEMLFRGYFLSAFTQNKTKLSAILGISISSIMFSILHFSIYKLPMTLIMGIAFAYIAYKSGSILISGIFHFLTNANALISYYTLMGADSEPVTALVLKDLSYVFISVIYLMAAVLFISLGVRSFKEKKTNKKRFIIYIAVLLVIAILVSLGALVLTAVNEMEIVTLIESS
ncbi:MAG: CPBP family intramembrane metalloprotease, partial [Clostridia bacterium]|nr:CPBP family intramembrane metalloprotease [Clostridia bacterium]